MSAFGGKADIAIRGLAVDLGPIDNPSSKPYSKLREAMGLVSGKVALVTAREPELAALLPLNLLRKVPKFLYLM
jgi:hypothetical protein